MLLAMVVLAFGAAAPANAANLAENSSVSQLNVSSNSTTVEVGVLQKHVDTARSAQQAKVEKPVGSDSVVAPLWGPSTVEINSTQYGVDMPQIVDSCQNSGGTCTIAQGKTIQTTISGNAGVNLGMISAGAGVSYAESYTVTTSCTSPVLGFDQTFAMRPQGTFIQFTYVERVLGVETGRYPGSAFVPTGVSCIIR